MLKFKRKFRRLKVNKIRGSSKLTSPCIHTTWSSLRRAADSGFGPRWNNCLRPHGKDGSTKGNVRKRSGGLRTRGDLWPQAHSTRHFTTRLHLIRPRETKVMQHNRVRDPFGTARRRLFVLALPVHVDTRCYRSSILLKLQGHPDYLGEQEWAKYKYSGDNGGNGAVQGTTEVFEMCSWVKNGEGIVPLLFNPLNFSRLMTYIYIYIYMSYRTANLQMLHFIYLFNKYTYWMF